MQYMLHCNITIALLLTTSLVIRVTLAGGYPEIGGASVEHNGESLRWSTNGDVAIILQLHTMDSMYIYTNRYRADRQTDRQI